MSMPVSNTFWPSRKTISKASAPRTSFASTFRFLSMKTTPMSSGRVAAIMESSERSMLIGSYWSRMLAFLGPRYSKTDCRITSKMPSPAPRILFRMSRSQPVRKLKTELTAPPIFPSMKGSGILLSPLSALSTPPIAALSLSRIIAGSRTKSRSDSSAPSRFFAFSRSGAKANSSPPRSAAARFSRDCHVASETLSASTVLFAARRPVIAAFDFSKRLRASR